ncbi:MAG TPA: hypothetical protein VJ722_06485 [Rhodanobacteraceae bacterium]|nr:hypothetical protein [Rhodanobacteraceae bacterium]
MEITQKRGSAKTRYVFHDDRLEYAWNHSSSSRTFSVPYIETSRDRQTLTERNTWFRNAGLFWMVIGLLFVASSWSRDHGASGWFWFVLGAGCFAYYHFHVARYVIIPSDKGNLLVIDDEDGKRIVNEIETRRAKQFREEYDFFPQNDSPELLRKRFNWLHREGALSDEELKARMEKVDALAQPAPMEQTAPGERLLH